MRRPTLFPFKQLRPVSRQNHALGAGLRSRGQLLILRALLLILWLNASLIWSLHWAQHFEQPPQTSFEQTTPADSDEGLTHRLCSQCQIFAHLIAPRLAPPEAHHPLSLSLAPKHELPAPPALTRSWLHFPRDPPDAA
ncbi:hypothetical protein [Uliginosibacterium sp. 31-12]|uniref:hypothetical protein n=1 Tax=Uliginosibacterium sp. 31-12 TaxID=3062781 RepID=UPI0026E18597|nr:hypothetical protein [Uliginosibacterium sp. 31-12]MDO6387697.1 hypothetical protein [Uliginosibacterium sp. 31-12]